MMSKDTIVVNGVLYDKHTGIRLRETVPASHSHHHASAIHTPAQHSRTLNRRYIASPAVKDNSGAKKIAIQDGGSHHTISRFAPQHHPKPQPVVRDIAPTAHPLLSVTETRLAAQKPAVHIVKPSQVIKQEAIAAATAVMQPAHTKKPVKPVKQSSRTRRAISVLSGSLALLLLGAYVTYLNMPSLSTRVAAAQAGINATYPGYQPSGYSLSGPVAYQEGTVSMKFAANAGPQSYTITQSRSDWDSSAVLENYVRDKAGTNYTISTTGGLTIYTYKTNAAWVNGGILYTITGDAPLSSDQIEHVATSL